MLNFSLINFNKPKLDISPNFVAIVVALINFISIISDWTPVLAISSDILAVKQPY